MKKDEKRTIYEDWLNELCQCGEKSLQKTVTRKELNENTMYMSCKLDKVRSVAKIGMILGVINFVFAIYLIIFILR